MESPGTVNDTSPSSDSHDVHDRLRLTRRRIRLLKWLMRFVIAGVLAGFVYWELQSSHLQSLVFSEVGSGVYHYVGDGPSETIRFPDKGPYDKRVGYTALPDIIDRLTREDYEITKQARISNRFAEIVDRGLFAPYSEKQRAGLLLQDPYDNSLHNSLYPTRFYESFDQIPKLIVDTLLHIENRSLLEKSQPKRNPALEPDRFVQALGEVIMKELAGKGDPSGASTLATQIEKFRHSPEGRTINYKDKFKQMMSASIRAYLDGAETLDDQKRIVLTYLNSVPLSAVEGFGEVFGVGDGLYAWYDSDFQRVNALLTTASETGTRANTGNMRAQARAYRKVLSLIVAQRRPSYFLQAGRGELAELTNAYLRKLAKAGVISKPFRDLALNMSVTMNGRAIEKRENPFRERKLVYTLRTHLLDETGRDSLYALDRLDLNVETTIDYDVQRSVEQTLRKLQTPSYVAQKNLNRWRLLHDNDPSNVVYSFTLYERTKDANVLRVQADTYDGPFNVNEGIKLNLGSTAKLRTTASYLQIIADLHEAYGNKSAAELAKIEIDRRDRLAQWARQFFIDHPEASLRKMLDAAMKRRYSADPDTFFTGGGLHHFSNFSHKYDHTWPTVRKGLENSINLVFVRLMRDIVRYHMFRLDSSDPKILMNRDNPKRRKFLEEFAAYEGEVYLRKFWKKYEDWNFTKSMIRMKDGRTFSAERLACVLRTIYPDADLYTFNHLLKQHFNEQFGWSFVKQLYADYSPEKYTLNELGYLARIHPLELWLLRYRREHRDAEWSEVLAASDEARQQSYEWLFDTSRKKAQDKRIRIMLEKKAFGRLHKQWQQLGYPFDELVPSYATALGSSADRPAALSDLMGIIVNDGVEKPTIRFRSLHFASGTPYETRLVRKPDHGRRVMRTEVAHELQDAIENVVEDGTAARLNRFDITVDGRKWVVGGKTGTGDNKFEIRNRHGTLIKAIPRNRTGTFAFHIDDRFFGAITVYVPGKKSGEYNFTSGLAVSILGVLAPKLRPLWWREHDAPRRKPRPIKKKTPKHLVSAAQTPHAPQSETKQ